MNQSPHFFGNRSQAAASGVAYDQGLRTYFQRIYALMGMGLLVSGAFAFAFYTVPALSALALNPMVRIGVLIAELVIVWNMASKVMTMERSTAQMLFWVFCALNGSMLAIWAFAYQLDSIARVFLITASVFGATSLYGYVTKSNLMGLGHYFRMALIGLIIAMVVNIFLQSSMMHYIMSIIGVGLFIGLTAYDTQRLKLTYDQVAGTDLEDKVAINGALTLYLDFINLFIFLLQLLGNRR